MSLLEFETMLADLSSRFINLAPGDVDREIEDALRRVCELLAIDVAVLWQWSTAVPDVITPTHVHPRPETAQSFGPLSQESYPWVVAQMQAGRGVMFSSLEELPPEAALDRESARSTGIKSNLTLPLAVGGTSPVGALAFNTLQLERDWPDALVKRLQLVAQVFSNALARKRAEENMRSLSRRLIRAQEEERALLARELHDDVTQRLAVLAIDAGRAELAAGGGARATEMKALRESLVRLSEDIHSLAYQLHPSVLEELGLAEALRTECERQGRRGDVLLTLDLPPECPFVGKDAALCLYRVAQEALSNVVRHARARTARVVLRPVDDGLLLAVRDDGVGFDPEGPKLSRNLGLASMRERVQLVHGTLDIESAPGMGTAIIAWVPSAGSSS